MSSSSKSDRAVVSAKSNLAFDSADIVIVGNGIAGITAALEARELAPEKRIVVVTDQIHPTINTPALKQYAIGKLERDQLLALPAGTERAKRIHLVNARVEEIHARSKYVTLSGNRGFGYGSLLLATGGWPQGLSDGIPGRDFDGVLTLHRLKDYMDLRRRLPEVREAIVVGGGVHSIETVMNLRYWGIEVHWLIRGKTFMRGILDAEASEIVLDHVRDKGVIVHTETEIKGVVGRMGMVAGAITNHQEMIPCQLIASCTGTKPNLELVKRSSIPIEHKNGIIVDDKLRSSVRDIYAAGDVAALRNPLSGRYEPRALWYAATFQGRIAGAMLAGRPELAREPFGVQWNATHLGDLSLLFVGDALSESDQIMTLTDRSGGGYRRLAIVGDRLIGYLSLGSTPPDSLAIKRIIDEGHSVRDIIKPLLKGQFDARQYLTQMRTRAAEGVMYTGNMPNLLPTPAPGPVVLPTPAPAPARVASTDPLQPAARQAVAAPRREANVAAVAQPMPVIVEDEINPFTGTLPSLSEQQALPTPQEMGELDEINPFAGTLPKLEDQRDEAVVSTGQRRSLWTYGAESPAGPSKTSRKTSSQPRHSSGLWAYAPGNKTSERR
jgi:NADPH-dependent 2,4-dienoyl-CoA reductase/sulfur reductase-like enzyme